MEDMNVFEDEMKKETKCKRNSVTGISLTVAEIEELGFSVLSKIYKGTTENVKAARVRDKDADTYYILVCGKDTINLLPILNEYGKPSHPYRGC